MVRREGSKKRSLSAINKNARKTETDLVQSRSISVIEEKDFALQLVHVNVDNLEPENFHGLSSVG